MDVWTLYLEDCDSEDANNGNEDIEVGDEESELDRARAQSTLLYRTKYFITCAMVQDMITAEIEKSTSHDIASLVAGIVEDKLIESLQVGYHTTKKGLKTLFHKLVGEVVVDIFQQGNMDTLLMRNTEAHTQPDRLMDALP